MASDSLFPDTSKTVPVLVPVPSPVPYSYGVPDGMDVLPGSVVQVPLGSRQVPGIVWDKSEADDKVDPKKLRAITQVFDCPPINADMRRFVDWVARYTLSAPGMVARMVLRVPTAFEPEAPVAGIRYNGGAPERMTAARQSLLELLNEAPGMVWTRSGLAHAAGVSQSVVDGLIKADLFEPVEIPPPPVVAAPDPDFGAPKLTGDQAEVAEVLS
ncbi:MAG: primosomal protein N', partial [Pseudomonadota bacterium]